VCGRATDPEAWAAIDIDRAKAMVVTSPPYGVGNTHHLRNHLQAGVKTPKTSFYGQHKDSADQWPELMRNWTRLALAHAACVVVNIQMLAENKRALVQWIADNADRLIDVIVWDKGRGPPCAAPKVLTTEWEFVVGLGDAGASRAWPFAEFQGNRTNTIRVPPVNDDDGSGHGARFPVDFPVQVLARVGDHARIVVDCFAGTGTTMIAAAKSGRACRMIEMDPNYCDVIRRRWTRWAKEAGQEPGPGALDG
jgi:DNA modification methylase